MNNIGDAASGPNVERLKYVTENFPPLQTAGLSFLIFGAAYCAQQMIDVNWKDSRWLGLLLVAGALVVMFVYVPKYYASRFGWIQQRQPSSPVSAKPILIGVIGLVAIWFTANVLQSLVRLPVNFLTLLQSVGLVGLVLYLAATSRNARTMPVRLTIWITLAVAQGVLAVLPLWFPLSSGQQVVWKLLNAGSLGILIMVMGLSNHIALVRLFSKKATGV